MHGDEPAARRVPRVLRGAALALAHLEMHVGRRQLQHLRDDAQRVVEPGAGALGVDLGRRRVLLHVHPLLVDVDGEGVVGQIGVVEAVAGDALAAHHAPDVMQVLA